MTETIESRMEIDAKRCVGKVMEQLDIIAAPEASKNAIKRAIWLFKDDIQLMIKDKENQLVEIIGKV